MAICTRRRFLHARDYDPSAAYKQYSASAAWRRQTKLDATYDNVDVQKFGRMNRVQPQWTGRRDRHGVPVMVYVLSEVRPKDLAQIGKEDPQLSEIFLAAEYVTRFTQRLCTRLPHAEGIEAGGGPTIDKSVNIIDLSNVGLRKFWNLRGLLQTASTMATAHYPETVERIFVVGAPFFFPTVWSLVTRWFDPNTTKKIFVLSAAQQKETILKYIDIKDLPKRFGGELEWNMGDHPNPDEAAKKMVGKLKDGWIDGPIRYISKPEGDVLMAVGSVDGKLRREVLVEYPPERPGNNRMATARSALSTVQTGTVPEEESREQGETFTGGKKDPQLLNKHGMTSVTDGLVGLTVSDGQQEVQRSEKPT